MNDQKIRRLAGGFGVGGFVVFLAALPLYFVGVGPGVPLEQTAQFSELVARTGTFVIIRTRSLTRSSWSDCWSSSPVSAI